jgi:hypothetical protein
MGRSVAITFVPALANMPAVHFALVIGSVPTTAWSFLRAISPTIRSRVIQREGRLRRHRVSGAVHSRKTARTPLILSDVSWLTLGGSSPSRA